jgi:hypothetical protein
MPSSFLGGAFGRSLFSWRKLFRCLAGPLARVGFLPGRLAGHHISLRETNYLSEPRNHQVLKKNQINRAQDNNREPQTCRENHQYTRSWFCLPCFGWCFDNASIFLSCHQINLSRRIKKRNCFSFPRLFLARRTAFTRGRAHRPDVLRDTVPCGSRKSRQPAEECPMLLSCRLRRRPPAQRR